MNYYLIFLVSISESVFSYDKGSNYLMHYLDMILVCTIISNSSAIHYHVSKQLSKIVANIMILICSPKFMSGM